MKEYYLNESEPLGCIDVLTVHVYKVCICLILLKSGFVVFCCRFSEMYIFGKFDTFRRRMEKIIKLLNVFETFSPLSEAMIEGIEPHAARLVVLVVSS